MVNYTLSFLLIRTQIDQNASARNKISTKSWIHYNLRMWNLLATMSYCSPVHKRYSSRQNKSNLVRYIITGYPGSTLFVFPCFAVAICHGVFPPPPFHHIYLNCLIPVNMWIKRVREVSGVQTHFIRLAHFWSKTKKVCKKPWRGITTHIWW